MAETNLQDGAETVHFDEFLPYVAVQVDGAPAPVMGHAIRLAAIDFALRLRSLRRTILMHTQRGVQSYTIAHTDHYSILQIESVRVCDRCLRAESISCNRSEGDWFAFEPPDHLFLGFAPKEDGNRDLEVRAVVVPGQDTCSIDRWVYDLHAETIASGAIQRLLFMSSEEWFDPTLGSLAGRQFLAGVSRAQAIDRGHYTTAPQGVPMPRGFWV